MKFITLFFFLLISLDNSSAKSILIDPGHGGEDCGAKGKYWVKKTLKIVCEKDIALSIAKEAHKLISKNHNAYLTRSVDRTLTLEQRAALADKIKADIFISIHINGSTSRSSRGFETFYLDNHDDAAVKKVEEVENKNSQGEQVIINKILADLVIDRTAPSSRKLSGKIHNRLSKVLPKKYGMIDRGVKPALFYVMALSKRPAILLEVGFISNQKELKIMSTKKFQKEYAKAIAQGVEDYFGKVKKRPPLL
ncbi:N-acetylmuramoyl-L-alanine amidase [Halobacteriovorax sp. HLS]|uniref:N-acetylmuramoyl-L-alanine amidase family protein n=1 Tax=Halobacteriovorax sp. HLS TaxID=2234000 RepID=UPI0013E36D67|nr:N-acetylmuramoyl-L-alanine amidase [Halobacteriovorax sp. HLS]